MLACSDRFITRACGSRPICRCQVVLAVVGIMKPHYDLLLTDGMCVFPWGEIATDVGVRDGRIVAIGSLKNESSDRIIAARGLHVLPGLIDSHVHLRDPGDDAIETVSSGTRP